MLCCVCVGFTCIVVYMLNAHANLPGMGTAGTSADVYVLIRMPQLFFTEARAPAPHHTRARDSAQNINTAVYSEKSFPPTFRHRLP